jgi:KDO2-lipid IV(A) lauroyltransferase
MYDSKRNFIIVMGHFGNWEMANHAFNLQCPNQLFAVYMPFSNTYFDQLIYHLRSRWGTQLIPIDDTYNQMKNYIQAGNATAFLADQTPDPQNAYWTTFLNQDTPIYRGTEVLSKRLDHAVIYLATKRIKRGFYRMHMELLIKDPKMTGTGEISERHTERLEQDILEQPEIWLWSHRRWKHQKPG